jgi:hypothetical protein
MRFELGRLYFFGVGLFTIIFTPGFLVLLEWCVTKVVVGVVASSVVVVDVVDVVGGATSKV